ncbi:hypothetical protein DF156_31825 [Burkholderia ubonensis]|uniref:Uncharacterized protein n=2 Tax=Burkholderia ubonensis TaxID=101571 RepID=A0AB74D3C9_9BURK|nr:hypothetical protein CJO71_06685 [Burkholderia ubonensis]PAJ88457.1 hypothetical protein CJO70_06495 [Burkholderia ubonensis]PAJ95005.1 hypothetical protein CJO69_08875 [Burkholderia ubonensis]PAJ99293.1 hypothetical protein CJO68_21940 [Burkholderia ubonensis]PAK08922.1 hypothetical protein CJO67_06235 [Burkholderia ubonensis]
MDSAIRQRIMMDPILGPCAEQVIYLWYVSAFFKKNPADPQKGVWQYGSAEQYDEALIWQVIRGHAPMTDGMTYGFWADPPAESIGFRDSARSIEHG